MSVHAKTYGVLERAFDHFNAELFGEKLPDCVITISWNHSSHGHYVDNCFIVGKKDERPEISLNPKHFSRGDRETYSTLVHEMVHLWQFRFGKPGKGPHNKEWADKMEEIGLHPSSTGAPGGKRTGKKVSHYIIEGGLFDKAEKKFKGKIPLKFKEYAKKPKKRRRVKYTCPSCDLNAYGKKDIHLVCGECSEDMEAQT